MADPTWGEIDVCLRAMTHAATGVEQPDASIPFLLAHLPEEVRALRRERDAARADVAALRKLCADLAAAHDLLDRVELRQAEYERDAARAEAETLRQLNREQHDYPAIARLRAECERETARADRAETERDEALTKLTELQIVRFA